MATIHIDFLSKKITHRREHTSLKKETLAKAMGLKGPKDALTLRNLPRIIDATAGFAQDSFILASLGFEITLLERSTTIYTLLTAAMTQAKQDPNVEPIINRMHLIQTDSIQYLASLKSKEKPNIIYLDPMFPERKKSALNKKEMRFLHETVGDDPDADQLLRIALACATERVVVKRPRLALPLADLKPTYCLAGSSSRFDIYLRGI